MSDKTSIEWTDATWNPTRGCSLVGPDCTHCYAMRYAARWPWGRHLTKKDSAGRVTWTGEVDLVESAIKKPLTWRKPRRIFVDSESDLFHEKVPAEWVDRVFAVMALCPQHVFQILTKRPERMRKYLSDTGLGVRIGARLMEVARGHLGAEIATIDITHKLTFGGLPNVWLGVSIGNQATADERIPHLLRTPAALRFVSYEPAIGPVDFDQPRCQYHDREEVGTDGETGEEFCNDCAADGSGGELSHGWWLDALNDHHLGWIIVGGESGPGARPFDVAWARSTIEQCKAAGVPCFVKQLGSHPVITNNAEQLDWPRQPGDEDEARRAGLRPGGGQWWTMPGVRDRKGGDMDEWAPEWRVREFPELVRGES